MMHLSNFYVDNITKNKLDSSLPTVGMWKNMFILPSNCSVADLILKIQVSCTKSRLGLIWFHESLLWTETAVAYVALDQLSTSELLRPATLDPSPLRIQTGHKGIKPLRPPHVSKVGYLYHESILKNQKKPAGGVSSNRTTLAPPKAEVLCANLGSSRKQRLHSWNLTGSHVWSRAAWAESWKRPSGSSLL